MKYFSMCEDAPIYGLAELMQNGTIGVNADQFSTDQLAILSAMAKTDRELLVRILAKVERTDHETIMQQAIKSDIESLKIVIDSSTKYVRS